MRTTVLGWIISGIMASCLSVGCEGTESKPFKCALGEEQACYCLRGLTGTQPCREDLGGWGPCVCDDSGLGDTGSDSDADGDNDTDSDGDTDSDTDTTSDADMDSNVNTDFDINTEYDSDTIADFNTDTGIDADTDTDSDADSDTDSDADGDSDIPLASAGSCRYELAGATYCDDYVGSAYTPETAQTSCVLGMYSADSCDRSGCVGVCIHDSGGEEFRINQYVFENPESYEIACEAALGTWNDNC